MRKFILSAIAVLFVATLWSQDIKPEWKSVGKGVEYCTVNQEFMGLTRFISAVRFKTCKHPLQLLSSPCENADSTSALGQKAGAIAAMNGSYFIVATTDNGTYFRLDGKKIAPTPASECFRVDGILALKGRKIIIEHCDTTGYDALPYKDIIAAGPVLLKGGKPVKDSWPKGKFFDRHHPRSLVGVDSKGRGYLIVIDGRFPKQGEGATLDETVAIARLFGLKDAINFDGGGSSTLWVEGPGVLNHPYDNRRFDNYGQRVVPNILYIK